MLRLSSLPRHRALVIGRLTSSSLVRAPSSSSSSSRLHPLAHPTRAPGSSLLLSPSVSMSSLASAHAADAFTSHGVVEDLTRAPPKQHLTVKFGDQEVQPGAIRLVADTQKEPTIDWTSDKKEQDDKALYTVIMADPDAPSRENPTKRNYLHWAVVNVGGPNDISKGHTIVPYMGPAPPPKTGPHRYIFLVYPQKGSIDTSKTPKLKDDQRGGWSLTKFLDEHSANIDGKEPLAANFFLAQNVGE